MQDFLNSLLWANPEIFQKVHELSQTLPGYQEAAQAHDAMAQQVQERLGVELYDSYFSLLMRHLDYECRAWYALGLGLREEFAKVFSF